MLHHYKNEKCTSFKRRKKNKKANKKLIKGFVDSTVAFLFYKGQQQKHTDSRWLMDLEEEQKGLSDCESGAYQLYINMFGIDIQSDTKTNYIPEQMAVYCYELRKTYDGIDIYIKIWKCHADQLNVFCIDFLSLIEKYKYLDSLNEFCEFVKKNIIQHTGRKNGICILSSDHLLKIVELNTGIKNCLDILGNRSYLYTSHTDYGMDRAVTQYNGKNIITGSTVIVLKVFLFLITLYLYFECKVSFCLLSFFKIWE